MRSIRRWAILSIAVLALGGGATALAAGGSTETAHSARVITAQPNKLTGYPSKIRRLNLAGYVIRTSYPLGKVDKGSNYKQQYTNHYVTASTNPGGGLFVERFRYIALPIAKNMFLMVWLEPHKGHRVLLFNMRTHIVSVVTAGQQGDPSLGAFKILRRGTHKL